MSVQTMRGLALVLLVLGHAYLNARIFSGMKPMDAGQSDGGWIIWFTQLTESARLPLFTILSGWVYGLRSVESLQTLPSFWIAKFRRLIIPTFLLSLLLFVLYGLKGGSSLANWFLFPDGSHLWFIYSLLLIFLVVGFIDGLGWLRKGWVFLMILLITLGVMIFGPPRYGSFRGEDLPNYLGWRHALMFLPFFLVGLSLQRFRDSLLRSRLTPWLVFIAAAGVLIEGSHALGLHPLLETYSSSSLDRFYTVCGGGGAAFLLYRLGLVVRPLAAIGQYGLSVFFFHGLALHFSYWLLSKVGVAGPGHRTMCLMAVGGIFLPILVEKTLQYSPALARLLIGQKGPWKLWERPT